AETRAARETAAATSRARPLESSSIRVSVEKVDELINLVGELVIAQSMVNQAIGHLPPETLASVQEALGAMNRSTRDIQERVMSVRMVPLANVFRRFPRVVRDLAAGMHKRIAVEIHGEDTELDKQMIEQIGDPLTHLVRNAADHGIEPPEDRVRAGKSPEGSIGLRAYHEGGSVVVEVSDDGRGLDRERIRRKAAAQGLIGADEPVSDDQLYALVFAPGFSTAEQVTDVSGRGVGMDVVKRNIEALNGSVSIESIPGAGSTFRIRLPLTLAILDGLAVGLSAEVYILPLLSVVESFRPKTAEVKSIAGRGEVVMVRGKPVPLVRLHHVFHALQAVTDPTKGLVVILENQGRRLGLLVDELLGQVQVVMKSLEANYQKVEGISGATILGDGQVAFILDVPGLSRLARREAYERNQNVEFRS
ncbi:MAG: chemotaxis protein CheA, partial [Pirellulales bacterium]|nr:chemotaxis protein CheA [Pirellulales bacterium]